MADDEKIRALVGFAQRAGKLAIGRSAVIAADQRRKLRLVIITQDASPKLDVPVSPFVPVFRFGEKQVLGGWLGRDTAAVIGVLDTQFAAALKRLLS